MQILSRRSLLLAAVDRRRPLVISVRVLFDRGAHDGRGLTEAERHQFYRFQETARREFAHSGLRFDLEFVEAYLRTQSYSEIPDQFLAVGRINVFVSDTLRLDVDSQRSGGSSAGPRKSLPGVAGSRCYLTFLGLREASTTTLVHEYAHHFTRDTAGKASTHGNYWADLRNDYWLWRQRRGTWIEEFRAGAGLPWAQEA